MEAKDATGAFATPVDLPTAGSLAAHTLMVDIEGQLVQSSRIERIDRVGEESITHTPDGPGMTITPGDPGFVKLEHFACWSVKGKASFRTAVGNVTGQ